MSRPVRGRLCSSIAAVALAVTAGACASAPSVPAPAPVAAPLPEPRPAPPPPPVAQAAPVLAEAFESDDFIVTFARPGDTAETLAARYLGDAGKAWMIEDYAGAGWTSALSPGQEVVIPKRPWNLSGVRADGYQIVPVLCYHHFGDQAKGRLVMATFAFREQMQSSRTTAIA